MTPKELKRLMSIIPVADTPPEPFTWARHRYELWYHTRNTDDPTKFLRWSTVEGTMVVGDVPYIREELRVLKAEVPDWRHITKAQEFGGEILLEDGISPNLVHQAYHLHVFERYTKLKISNMKTIVEIGGGFGAMAVAAYRFGFNGTYHIYDLPEFSLLQEYYLSHVQVHTQTRVLFDTELFIPNETDLLIGMWSIGEMPTEERQPIYDEAKRIKHFLFSFMPDWGGVNNTQWFAEFAYTRPGSAWYTEPAACSSIYLIGKRLG